MKELSLKNLDIESSVQRTALIIIIGIILNAALIYFGILPLRSRISVAQKNVEETIHRNDRFKKTINTADTTKNRVSIIQDEHDELVAKGVLKPLLNSYAMMAKTIIEPIAERCSLKIENVDELPSIPLQHQKPLKNEVFCRQPIMFSASGSYTQLTAFISRVEQEVPMAVLSSLKIISQQRSPESHAMAICFEWPVKTRAAEPQTK